jgi:hypothetical protein
VPTPNEWLKGYQGAIAQLRNRTVGAASSVWLQLPNYRDSNIERFKELVVPIVHGAQIQTANLTAGFQQAINRERGANVPLTLLDRAQILEPRGVAASVVYQRPANTVYTALSENKTMTVAVGLGLERLQQTILTDLQMVKVAQSSQSLRAGGFTYYRRVLTGAENCALCVIASTQRYRVGDLLPIHPACDCDVDAVTESFDPGQVIDGDLLETTHGQVEELVGVAARDGRTVDYRNLIVTREHGEIGSVLTWRNNNFTGPSDL